jgi:hypothetical protein
MLTIYCEKCRTPQQHGERNCLKCHHPFGGSIAWLIAGLALSVGGPLFLLLWVSPTSITQHGVLQTVFFWVLPVLILTLCTYDHDGRRVMAYFGGGGVIVVAGVIWLVA